MIDISRTIAPKSDQLNADDLIGQPKTIRITGVSPMREPEQPIAISFEGDGGKPYKPCKSMRRVLVRVWGVDGTAYVGRRMTLYRDDKVRFGGAEVGGIRISHMSDIAQSLTFPLTASRASRIAYTVRPLAEERRAAPEKVPSAQGADAPTEGKKGSGRERLYIAAREAASQGADALAGFRKGLEERADRALDAIAPELQDLAAEADLRTADHSEEVS